MVQEHLTYKQMTNLGCFYTPTKFVDVLAEMIKKNIEEYQNYILIDTSCGYGSFFKDGQLENDRIILADIDEKALKIAKKNIKKKESAIHLKATYINANGLKNVSREKYSLKKDDKIVIIGNPPYNDITSRVKNEIKVLEPCEIDTDIKTRDLGISFLLSFNRLQADYIAMLHPLSYMIKETNYRLLKPFYDNYSIVDSLIINSQEFNLTSRSMGFPIVIILYKRDSLGISYNRIMQRDWKTIDGKSFNLNIKSIKHFITKYPSKYKVWDKKQPLFWTMRDINALKRSQTFVNEYSYNTIIVDKNRLEYYCYVDIFKDFTSHIPYYFGNCDVFIDEIEFEKAKNDFVLKSIEKHPSLQEFFPNMKRKYDINVIEDYFKKLLGKNYIY
jgi:predicted RNA methylase